MNNFRSAILGGKSVSPATPLIAEKRGGSAASDDLASVEVAREAKRAADHRNDDRHRLSEESAAVRFKGKRYDVDLINLSGGGAMIGTDIKPLLWDRVDLILGEGDAIECAVRWLRDDRIGLEFAHETRIDCAPEQRDAILLEVIRRSFPEIRPAAGAAAPAPAKLSPAEPVDESRRGDQRHPLIWNGEILWRHDTHTVRLRNVSTSGVLIDCPVSLPAGGELMLDLGGNGQYFATVSWSRGGQAGLVFSEPFDLSVLASVRPAVAEGWQRPDFLALKANQASPWAEQWERSSLEQLQTELEGFLKR